MEEKKSIILGKDELMNKGWCQNLECINFETYRELLKVMKGWAKKEVMIVSATPQKIMSERVYVPKIYTYSEERKAVVDPMNIFINNLAFKEKEIADFVIFEEADDIAVAAYSNNNPIISFFSKRTGKKCIGTIQKDSLEKYGIRAFNNIAKKLGGDLLVTLEFAANRHNADSEAIANFLCNMIYKSEWFAGFNFNLKERSSEQNKNLFAPYDYEKNNVVILL